MSSPTIKLALSARDAAVLLGISERTLHNLRASPDFPAARIVGGRNRWLTTELQAFLESRPRATVGAEPPQLRGTRKRPSLSPTPSQWPVPGTVNAGTADVVG